MKAKTVLLNAAMVATAITLVLFAPRDGMRSAVEAFGFRDVAVGGVAWRGCGEGDIFRRTWTAHDRDGSIVSGVVCGGPLTAWAVRITRAKTVRTSATNADVP